MDKVEELGRMVLERMPQLIVGGNVLIHRHYGVEGLSGEIDFWSDGSLYDIKMSHERRADLNWVMQLMCYKGMMREDVERFYVYNVMMGNLVEIPCVELERCRKLVKYLSNL